MRVSELTGRALDHAVARARGWIRRPAKLGGIWEGCDIYAYGDTDKLAFAAAHAYKPTASAMDCGPLIVAGRVTVVPLSVDEGWDASSVWLNAPPQNRAIFGARRRHMFSGAFQIAVCRAFVYQAFGDVLPDDVVAEVAFLESTDWKFSTQAGADARAVVDAQGGTDDKEYEVFPDTPV